MPLSNEAWFTCKIAAYTQAWKTRIDGGNSNARGCQSYARHVRRSLRTRETRFSKFGNVQVRLAKSAYRLSLARGRRLPWAPSARRNRGRRIHRDDFSHTGD